MHMMGNGLFGFLFLALLFFLLVRLIIGVSGTSEKKDKKNPELNLKKKIKHYKEAGLSDTEIEIFRETMSEAKRQIDIWSKASQERSDLSVIEDVTGGVISAKKTFQFIVQNPQELTKQNTFLYKDLPNMVKLIESHGKLQAVAKQNERDISEILLLIRTLSSQIADNYRGILMRDIKIIEKEVQNG